MKKNIIIFEDDTLRREGLCTLLNLCDDLSCSAGFVNAANAVREVQKHNPHLILMDIDMPGGDGVTGTRKIKSQFPEIPIIIQTVFEDNNNIFEALKAGANGYILKKTPPDKFLQQLREAINGEAPMTPSVAVKVLQFFNQNPKVEDFDLTKREKELLKLLVVGNSYKMIAVQTGIAQNTVSNHIKKIYRKLQVNSATEAVNVAIKNNLA